VAIAAFSIVNFVVDSFGGSSASKAGNSAGRDASGNFQPRPGGGNEDRDADGNPRDK
jgi:hypothetical protein